MVEKKYIKIGVAGVAAAALIIGLSVGITQKNKNSKNMSASNVMTNMDDKMYEHCSTTSGKSGKSGGSSGKSGKSGGSSSYSYSYGKSGKSGGSSSDRRRLVVPGTEDYAFAKVVGRQGKLRSDLQGGRGLEGMDWGGSSGGEASAESSASTKSSTKSKSGGGSGKSGKSGGDMSYSSGKSGKSGGDMSYSSGDDWCPPPVTDICTSSTGKSGKSGGSSGKSGKSGGDMSYSSGKSGKSGGDMSYSSGKSGKSGLKGEMSEPFTCVGLGKGFFAPVCLANINDPREKFCDGDGDCGGSYCDCPAGRDFCSSGANPCDDSSLPYCSSGKSGKSGGGSGKSGKSGGDMSYSSGKSGKSGGNMSYGSDDVPCQPKPSPAPSICAPTVAPTPTDPPTAPLIPTSCSCDDPTEDWKYIFVNGKCTLTIDMCADDDAMSLTRCCDNNGYPLGGGKECPIDDSVCIPPIPITPAPSTPAPSTPAPSTPAPSPSPTFITISTLNPTEQGTVTVAKESDGVDTQGDREGA